MDDETIQQLIEQLGPISRKLGEGAEFTFDAARQAVIASAWINMIMAVVFLLLCIVIGVVGWRVTKLEISDMDDNAGKGDEIASGFGVTAVVMLFPAAFLFINIADSIRKFVATDWYALETILEGMRNIT